MAPSAPTYKIMLNPAKCLIRINFGGFWDPASFDEYDLARHRAFDTMAQRGCSPMKLKALIDVRNMLPQAQNILPRIESVRAELQRLTLRSAIIVESALLKLQGARLVTGDRIRMVRTEAEAMAWLENGA